MTEGKNLKARLPGNLNFGVPGEDGATFTPAVDDEGNLSWSNDKGLENPETKNVRGPAGQTPHIGVNGNWWIGETDTGVPATGSGGGLSITAANLLVEILRNGVYGTDQSANITALAAELGVTEAATYTITNTLTNVINSNSAASVTEGKSYKATLTAEDGYELNNVTVIMGGADITAAAYTAGVVTIGAVTGDVVITAVAVESGESGLETIDLTPYLKGSYYISTVYNGNLIRWEAKDNHALYCVPVEQGCTYRLYYTAANSYTGAYVCNSSIKTLNENKILLYTDAVTVDFATATSLSQAYTNPESVTVQYGVDQGDGTYLYAVDFTSPVDATFVFSGSFTDLVEWMLAKVVA